MKRPAWLALCCSLLLSAAQPARAQFPFDVPYVPTPQVVVDEMLRLANVRADEFVMDLGSGDGRILITAARKFGARGMGVELDFHLLIQAEAAAEQAGVQDRVKFLQQDLFKTDLGQANVITMYLLPTVNRRLLPTLLKLKPGTRIVSHDFDLGDWQPDRKVTIRKNIFLWIVPAQAGGRWQLTVEQPGAPVTYDLELRQTYQMIDGLTRADGRVSAIWQPVLEGDRISFQVVDARDRDNEATFYLDGVVRDGVMEGEARRGVGNMQTRHRWRAVRTGS